MPRRVLQVPDQQWRSEKQGLPRLPPSGQQSKLQLRQSSNRPQKLSPQYSTPGQRPQSPSQLEHVSPGSQTQLPHCGWHACGGLHFGFGSGSGQAPQSCVQLEHVSPPPQIPSPQTGHPPQSWAQLEHVSPPLQLPSPQYAGHAPQSCAQLLQVSPASHTPSPQWLQHVQSSGHVPQDSPPLQNPSPHSWTMMFCWIRCDPSCSGSGGSIPTQPNPAMQTSATQRPRVPDVFVMSTLLATATPATPPAAQRISGPPPG
jgi:hypothetical protein